MKKIVIGAITISFIVVVVGISGVAYLVCNPDIFMEYYTSYQSRNPKEAISYLQRCYQIQFPQSMTNIQAATAGTDLSFTAGRSTFILKFQADAKEVDDFFSRLRSDSECFEFYTPGSNKIESYTPGLDTRFQDKYPKWFQSPIKSGQAGSIMIKFKTLEFYIDTSNENYSVVYMEGIYREA